jgi:DNA-binding CsgD family transcriptional regulator
MGAYVEVWGRGAPELFPLDSGRTTVGRDGSNAIALGSDDRVSRLHAVIESFGAAFVVRDLGSSNGTFVNGDRLEGERRLRAGDEVRAGDTRMVFRMEDGPDLQVTAGAEGPPALTNRERDVLVALCRPLLFGEPFAQPASIRQLASDLVVSQAAVKFHLSNLYDKFDIHATRESRRVQLANEAVRRRAVSIADLRMPPSREG